jgi:hypothetical protein
VGETEGFERGIIAAVSSVSPAVVDRVNIARAANLAAWRSLNKILDESDFIKRALSLMAPVLKEQDVPKRSGFRRIKSR